MTYEEIEKIMEKDYDYITNKDSVFEGLKIIAKYTDDVVGAAEHDIIYSEDVEVLIEAGITKEDVEMLAKLNWHIEEDCFCHFT
jgi:hypothetical protein